MPSIKLTGKLIAPDTDKYVGTKGEIFFDPHGTIQSLRRSDGITPGGQILSGGGGGNVGIDGLTVRNSFDDDNEIVLADGTKVSITELSGYLLDTHAALTAADLINAEIAPGENVGNGTLTVGYTPGIPAVGNELGSDLNPFVPNIYAVVCVNAWNNGDEDVANFDINRLSDNVTAGSVTVLADTPGKFWIQGLGNVQFTLTMGSIHFSTNDHFVLDLSIGSGRKKEKFARLPGNFAQTVDLIFNINNLVNYWMFNEKPTFDDVVITDYSTSAQSFSIPPIPAFVLGSTSAVNDGNTGLKLSTGLSLPYHPQQWGGFKNYQSIILAVNFTEVWDFVEVRTLDGAGNTGVFLKLYTNGECSISLANQDGGDFMKLRLPSYPILAGKALVCFSWDNYSMTLRVNKNSISAPLSIANGLFVGPPGDLAEGSTLLLNGGSDSPVVSHLMFAIQPTYDPQWAMLLNAAGFDAIGTLTSRVPSSLATADLLNLAMSPLNLPLNNYWTFEGTAGTSVVDVAGGNALRTIGETSIDWQNPGVINDGRTAMILNGQMECVTWQPLVWQYDDFTYGIIVDTSRAFTPTETVFDLRGGDADHAAMVFKAEIRITRTAISGRLFNDIGQAQTEITFGDNWVLGPGRFFVILQYSSGDNLLNLWVNGYNKTADTSVGNGTPKSNAFTLDGNQSTFGLTSNAGAIHSMFYANQYYTYDQIVPVITASGLDHGLFRPRGMTGTVYQGDPATTIGFTVEDGVIVGLTNV